MVKHRIKITSAVQKRSVSKSCACPATKMKNRSYSRQYRASLSKADLEWSAKREAFLSISAMPASDSLNGKPWEKLNPAERKIVLGRIDREVIRRSDPNATKATKVLENQLVKTGLEQRNLVGHVLDKKNEKIQSNQSKIQSKIFDKSKSPVVKRAMNEELARSMLKHAKGDEKAIKALEKQLVQTGLVQRNRLAALEPAKPSEKPKHEPKNSEISKVNHTA